jgi:membrane protein YdbS with pleckstrin-like domain
MGRVEIPEPDPGYDPGEPPQIDPEELSGLQSDIGSSSAVRRVLPLEDEASGLVARYLFPTERYRGEWKRHFIHLVGPMTWGFLATLGLGWLSGLAAQWAGGALLAILVLLWLAMMGYLGWRVADWHFDRFILTNKRVMKVSGIITRKVAMMPLLRVTDMKYEQSPLGRMLNYGTFVLESAGQDQALREVPYLPNPNELYLRVVEEMYEPAAVEARMGGSGDESEEEHRAGDS